MAWFWQRNKSKDVLKERLKLTLAYDRAQLAPGMVDALKNDLLEVLKRYFPAEHDALNVELEQRGEKVVMIANIPLR
ncbi:Cell division topological specificity factor [Calidithermus terrae]|uniref:Cell division topological specificity factor n=1 Tax=Calidithermus terrae TaxID=1408545 RepID=A0A399EP56_9DEIN|nr:MULTISPECIES: cell division topological specificity factor MinE [Calidithermus]RIH86407.1 Cell division topological specificity factor [Calidithermus terrae]